MTYVFEIGEVIVIVTVAVFFALTVKDVYTFEKRLPLEYAVDENENEESVTDDRFE